MKPARVEKGRLYYADKMFSKGENVLVRSELSEAEFSGKIATIHDNEVCLMFLSCYRHWGMFSPCVHGRMHVLKSLAGRALVTPASSHAYRACGCTSPFRARFFLLPYGESICGIVRVRE